MRFFDKASLKSKLFGFLALAGLGVAAIGALSTRTLRETLVSSRVQENQLLVEAGLSVLRAYEGYERAGFMSRSQAQAESTRVLEGMRFGDSGYYFIINYDHVTILHPGRPELVGRDLRRLEDADGKRLIIEMVAVARRQQAGTVEYLWPKPGRAEPQPKLSYVQVFDAWEWVIGTGSYVDDVDQAYWEEVRRIAAMGGIILAAMALFALGVARNLVGRFERVVGLARRLADGDLSSKLPVDGDDELSEMTSALNRAVDSMRETFAALKGATERERVRTKALQAAEKEQLRQAVALSETERRLSVLIGNLQGMVYRSVGDVRRTMIFISDGCRQLSGHSVDELSGAGPVSFTDLIVPEDRAQVIERIDQSMKAGLPFSIEYRIKTASGDVRWVWDQGRGVFDEMGNLVSVEGYITDVSDRKRANESLNKLSRAVEQSGSAILISDVDGRIEYVNPRFTEVTGFKIDEVRGRTPRLLNSGQTPQVVIQELWETILSGKTWHGELQNRKKSGELYWSFQSISSIRDESGKITHFISAADDVTDIKKAQMHIERIAFYDMLTGLANRRLFLDRLDQALRLASREDGRVVVLFLDLDQFKLVNDTLGHDAGDQLLKDVARRLEACVRSTDTVARLGGDEFAIILPKLGDPAAGARRVASEVLDALGGPSVIGGREVTVTTSIGITSAPADGKTPDILMRNGDLAMYRAKAMGRNSFQFFSEDMNVEAETRLNLENELRRALERQEFTLHFQPQLETSSRDVIGVEALIRWMHPRRGYVGPQDFISVAEETGLIIPIGEWVLNEACREGWRLSEDLERPIRVAVNLSPRQFRSTGLVDSIQTALEEAGLPPELLELEITESMLADDIEEAIDMLRRLKGLGVSLSIDDFGTGYSSLSYLKQLPIDVVKVDRSFIRDIPKSSDGMEITAAVIAMAHKLRLKVVGEGVETKEQLEFLQANHCDYVQGYFFSEAVSADDLALTLKRLRGRQQPTTDMFTVAGTQDVLHKLTVLPPE